MTCSFHPEAVAEFNEAIDYYESMKPGLGYEFATEVLATVQRCADFPKAWVAFSGDIRRSLVRRFPYGILYAESPQGIDILAVMNLHREPDYWKNRM